MLCASQTSWFPGDSGGLTNSSALGLLQPEKYIQIFLSLKLKKNLIRVSVSPVFDFIRVSVSPVFDFIRVSVSPVFDKLELNYSTIKYTHV